MIFPKVKKLLFANGEFQRSPHESLDASSAGLNFILALKKSGQGYRGTIFRFRNFMESETYIIKNTRLV